MQCHMQVIDFPFDVGRQRLLKLNEWQHRLPVQATAQSLEHPGIQLEF